MSEGPNSMGAQHVGGTRTLIFEVSTLYGAATLAAALDAGLFGARDDTRRVLLTSHNAAVPETATRLREMAGWHTLAARFDTVLDWNETIFPLHPSDWAPSEAELPVWQRLLSENWGLSGPLTLVVESIQAPPAATLASIFAEADIEVYADGLMSYGPTREKLRQATASRVQRLLHLDLVPGLEPLLLSEYQVPAEAVPDEAFRKVLDEISTASVVDDEGAPTLDEAARGAGAVLLGQYLAALNLLTVEEEEQLHVRMLRGAVAAGHRTVLFKPHPTAPASYSRTLAEAAADTGAELVVLRTSMLAETVFDRVRPRLVVGCFSTAMFTASTYYGIPVARVGTELLLDRLTPFQNSNRVPVTLVDYLVPELSAEGPGRTGQLVRERADESVRELVRAVGYCMQAKLYPSLRTDAQRWLTTHLGPATTRYFKKRRLTALELPGGMAPPRVVGQLRRLPGSNYAVRALRRAKRKKAAPGIA